jgi:hypothetical protein
MPINGNKLVYRVSLGSHSELRELQVRDKRERVLIGGNDGRRLNARWSPDGSLLAYDVILQSSGAQLKKAAAVLGRDGIEHLLTTPGSDWTTFGWSQDGRHLLGSCRRGTPDQNGICLLPIDAAPNAERHVRVITSRANSNVYQAQFSPESRWILFMALPRFEGGISTVNVVPASGGDWTPITEGRSYEDNRAGHQMDKRCISCPTAADSLRLSITGTSNRGSANRLVKEPTTGPRDQASRSCLMIA